MSVFQFKQFTVHQSASVMKVGTDSMVLGAFVHAKNPRHILDIGAGTGVISLMLAQQFDSARVQAVEIDKESAEECRINFTKSPWSGRLEVIQGDFLESDFRDKYEVIVSNPPYYQTRKENFDARKSQARHEAALPMEPMLQKVYALLKEAGAFWVIVPMEVQGKWIKSAKSIGFYCTRQIHIYGKQGGDLKRYILVFEKNSKETSVTKFTVRDNQGRYSDAYVELTQAFHSKDLREC